MKPKTVVLLGVAIVCGLMAAYLVSMATSRTTTNQKEVLVAVKDLNQGALVDDLGSMFKKESFDADKVPVGAVVYTGPESVELLKGKQLKSTIYAGQMVMQNNFDDYKGLQKDLEKGERAMAVRVTLDSSVAGFVLQGAVVDLICTVVDQNGTKRSKIFLQNMRVLAVNQSDSRPEGTKVVAAPSVITFAVTPKQAEKLNWVASQGIVTMVLRKPNDKDEITTDGAIGPFDPEKKDDKDNMVDVLVATRDIERATKLEAAQVKDAFETKRLPKDQIKGEPATAADVVAGATLKRDLLKDYPLTKAHIGDPGVKEVEVPGVPVVHTLTIRNGAQPAMAAKFESQGPAVAPREEAPQPKGPAPKGSGSEGK